MTATFTPGDSVLTLMEYQLGKMQLIRTAEADRVRRMALVLAQAARILDIPTIVTTNLEHGLHGPMLPELVDILPKAYQRRIARVGLVDAWSDPDFKAAVAATGRRNVIMAGVTTDACVVFSALAAAREGYRVQAVVDASGSSFALSEELARRRMIEAGVVLTATNTLIAELAENWSTPQGRELQDLLFAEILPPIRRQRRQPTVKRYGVKPKAVAVD